MQKLDEIRRAEEAAVDAVERARGRADAELRAADAEAARILEAAKVEAAERTASIRDVAMSTARAEAGRIESQSADDVTATTANARARLTAAVSAVVAAVTE